MNVKDLFDLSKKVAVVTGGGRGIGKFIAKGLAEAGADVVIASRKLDKLQKTAEEIAALGVRCLPVKCDMAIKDDILILVGAAMKEFGAIDILVNNAGVTWGAPTLEFPLEQWDKIFSVNVRGVWILTQEVAKIMKEKGGGKIINISSIMAFRGSIEEAHPALPYNPSKAAVNLLTMNLAVVLVLLLVLSRLARSALCCPDARPIVVFSRWGFVGLSIYLVLLYGVTYIFLRPQGLPSAPVQLLTFIFYAPVDAKLFLQAVGTAEP